MVSKYDRHLYLHLTQIVKSEPPGGKVSIEQSQPDRSKKLFTPVSLAVTANGIKKLKVFALFRL